LGVDGGDHTGTNDPGIRDYDVELTEVFDGLGDCAVDGGSIGDVGNQGPSVETQLCGHVLKSHTIDVDQRDAGPSGHEFFGYSSAQTGGRAGNKDNVVVEIQHGWNPR
jgi:hypothetical protein